MIRKLVTALLIALIAAMMAAGTALAQPGFETGQPETITIRDSIPTVACNAPDSSAVQPTSGATDCGVHAAGGVLRSPHFNV